MFLFKLVHFLFYPSYITYNQYVFPGVFKQAMVLVISDNLLNKKGFTQNGDLAQRIKAGYIVQWLKEDFELGRGYAMAIYALLKGMKSEDIK